MKTLTFTGAILPGGFAGFLGYLIFILCKDRHFQLHFPLLLIVFGGMAGGMFAEAR